MGQVISRSRGQGSQSGTLKNQGRVYANTPQTEAADQLVIQGMFLLSRLCVRILFYYGASHSFIIASCVKESVLEVENLEKPLHVSSPLGTRVNVDLICRDYELETSKILLIVDLRVIDMSEFDVILRIDWLTAHRVIIDSDRRRVTSYT